MLEIVDQIINVLASNGDSNKVVVDSEFLSLFSWDGSVGHQSWVFDQRFDTSQTLGQGEDLEALQESLGLVNVTLHVHGDHTSTSVSWSSRLLLGNFVLWMRFKTWIDNLGDLRVLLKESSASKSVLRCSSDSEFEGLGSSKGEPAVEG